MLDQLNLIQTTAPEHLHFVAMSSCALCEACHLAILIHLIYAHTYFLFSTYPFQLCVVVSVCHSAMSLI
jgi:hypothetical protein